MPDNASDSTVTLAILKRKMAEFVADREWQKFHLPKNLAMSLAVEAAELMELFQWRTPDEIDALVCDRGFRERLAEEMADILAFLLSLANVTDTDLSGAFEQKMASNERKYPADKVRGTYSKPSSDPPTARAC